MSRLAGHPGADRRLVHAPAVRPGVRDRRRTASRSSSTRIREHRPVLVDGYAESLNFLATYVRRGRQARLHPEGDHVLRPDAARQRSRELIEQAFGTRVFDKYGSREFSGIAYECGAVTRPPRRRRELHRRAPRRRSAGPARRDRRGRHHRPEQLLRAADPLPHRRPRQSRSTIRSRVPCGRALSRIGRIEGRTQAIVHCADGTWLPGTFFAHFFKDYEYAIRFFQVHQTEVGAMTLRLVKNPRFTQEALDELLEGLRGFTGEEMRDPGRVRRRDPARGDRQARPGRLGRRPGLSATDPRVVGPVVSAMTS